MAANQNFQTDGDKSLFACFLKKSTDSTLKNNTSQGYHNYFYILFWCNIFYVHTPLLLSSVIV